MHKTIRENQPDRGRKVLHTFNRYLAAEYNTTAIRAHRAADWEQFEAERDVQHSTNPAIGGTASATCVTPTKSLMV